MSVSHSSYLHSHRLRPPIFSPRYENRIRICAQGPQLRHCHVPIARPIYRMLLKAISCSSALLQASKCEGQEPWLETSSAVFHGQVVVTKRPKYHCNYARALPTAVFNTWRTTNNLKKGHFLRSHLQSVSSLSRLHRHHEPSRQRRGKSTTTLLGVR